MGSSGTMVDDMAEAVGMPAVTLAAYTKMLRSAGMITSAGRGTSAAKMQASDFTALLIAALTQPSIAQCAERTRQIWRLPFAKRHIVIKDRVFAGKADIQKLVESYSPLETTHQTLNFGDAIKTLLQALEFGARPRLWHPPHTDGSWFRIAFTSPGDIAIIEQDVRPSYKMRYVYTEENVDRFDENVSIYDWQSSRAKSAAFDVRTLGSGVLFAALNSMVKPIIKTRLRRKPPAAS